MRSPVPLALLVTGLSVFAACSDPPAPSSSSGGSSSSGSSGAPVSFKEDVAPLLATSCALAACHSSKESNLNFYITYEPAQIYAELMKTSPTCETSKFVVPGKPAESMVMLKMDNEQDKLPERCGSARRSEMPPGDPPKSGNALLDKEDRDLVRRWIAQGAKDN
ncbi:MAG: hypothetical protein KF764_31105 [Labilithrix sp.]|nr:hypothetical protein [Labilithrix sp.]MBX3219521.1 hypothetical protein [Labilithrix sp.]